MKKKMPIILFLSTVIYFIVLFYLQFKMDQYRMRTMADIPFLLILDGLFLLGAVLFKAQDIHTILLGSLGLLKDGKKRKLEIHWVLLCVCVLVIILMLVLPYVPWANPLFMIAALIMPQTPFFIFISGVALISAFSLGDERE